MDLSTPMLIGIAIIIGLVAGIFITRKFAAGAGVTDAMLDAAAAKFVKLASDHEASNRAAALNAAQGAEKRALLLKQTLEKVSGAIPAPPAIPTPPAS